jgi:ADP-heptose:LPS heptosyltransferase
MGGIGDLIMLSSAIKALKKQKPELEITLATLPQHVDLYKDVSWLKDCISLGTFTKMIFERVIDLRYRVESPEVGGTLNTETYKTVNRMDIFENLLGVKADRKDPEILVDQKSLEIVKKKIDYIEGDKWLGIQATCTSNLRTFPPEYIEPLVRKFAEIKGLKIVLFGKTEFWHGRRSYVNLKSIDPDGEGPNIVNIMDDTDLKELVALISLMDFVVSPDSSAIHIAAALKKKCLAVFGNIDPYTRIFYYPTVKPLFPTGELSCIPCHDFKNPCEHYKGVPIQKEPVGGKCMWLLTPERIFESGKEWFEL